MLLPSKLVTLALPLTAAIVAANPLVATPKQQLDLDLTDRGTDPITVDGLPPSNMGAIMASMSPVMLEGIGFSSEKAATIAKVIAEAEAISSEMFEKMGFSHQRAVAIAASISLQERKREPQPAGSEEVALSLLAAFRDDVSDMPKGISQYPRLPKGSPEHVACCVFTLFFCPRKSEIHGRLSEGLADNLHSDLLNHVSTQNWVR